MNCEWVTKECHTDFPCSNTFRVAILSVWQYCYTHGKGNAEQQENHNC